MRLIINFTITILFLIISAGDSFSCNGGCPSGGGYLGIVPQFSKNFIGLRYRMRSFSYTDNAHLSGIKSNHQFQTAELWGRFYPSERIQAFFFVPYQINAEKSESRNYAQGIGDMSFIVNYTVVNSGDSVERDWKHTLLLGAGAKLPTGKYQKRDAGKVMYPVTFQPGTGAYSFIGSGIYTVRYKKTGLNTNLSYYYNGKNELDYSFGNLLSANASLFYWLRAGSVSFLPSAGTYLEHSTRDIDNGYYVDNTGGTIAYTSFGLDMYINRIALSMTFQTPFAQHLPNRTQKNDLRLLSSIVWLF